MCTNEIIVRKKKNLTENSQIDLKSNYHQSILQAHHQNEDDFKITHR